MSYKLIYGSQMILRLVDNAVIPPSWGNQDYRAYQDWLAAGNTPEPADPPPDPGPQIDYTAAETAQTGFRALPNWATWTPAEGKVYVQANVLSGMTAAEAGTWIDTNVTTLATAKTALKLLATAIVDLREITAVMALAILYLRDVTIRK